MKKLGRNFYDRNTLDVAKALLGKYLVRSTENTLMISRIVETEAYLGPEDKAAHSYGGRRTAKNEVMYGQGGYAYVYQIYGMYFCLNAVTEKSEKPTAVLIRAVEPIEGLNAMSLNRYSTDFKSLTKKQQVTLTNGPGKLCKALDIDKSLNGIDLCTSAELFICNSDSINFEVCSSPRVGIDYAEEYISMPWRFFIKDNKYVSKSR